MTSSDYHYIKERTLLFMRGGGGIAVHLGRERTVVYLNRGGLCI